MHQKDCPSGKKSNPGDASISLKARMRQLLDEQLLQTVFQPIVDMRTGEVAGHEVLTRPATESGLENAEELFSSSESTGSEWELEALARRLAIEAAADWPAGSLLFMNSSPGVLADPRFVQQIVRELQGSQGVVPSRIVLEITERCRDSEFANLPHSVEALRRSGFHIAIDDVGAGTSGLNRIMSLRPDWLKLDRELVDQIDRDKVRQHMVRFLVHFARLSGINVIAEGIERLEELDMLIELGVGYGQGYLLGRPGAPVKNIERQLAHRIRTRAQTSKDTVRQDLRGTSVRSLAREARIVDSTTTVGEAATSMLHDLRQPGLVIVDGERFAGWCDRDAILRAASDGRSVLPISFLVGSKRTTIDASMPLVEALELAGGRDDHSIGSPLVVLDDARIVGVISVADLLQAAAEACRSTQFRNVSLTGLPGRVRTDLHLREMLDHARPGRCYDVGFVDLRGFATYNHAFGFEWGDQLIQKLVTQIRHSLLCDVDDAFIGHLGDDQFIVTAPGGVLEANLQSFITEFERSASMYTPATDTQETQPGVRVMILLAAVPTCREPQELYRARSQLRLMLDRGRGTSSASGLSQSIRLHATEACGELARLRVSA